MFYCVVITVFISCLCIGPVSAQSQLHQVAEVRTFDLVYDAEVHSLPSERKDVAIWIPLPQSDDHQDILDLRIDAQYEWTVETESEYGNTMLHLALNDTDVETISVTLYIRARRHEYQRQLTTGAHPEPFDGRWLMPDRLVPLDAFVTDLAMKVTEEAGTEAAKARAIYDYVVDTMTYDKSGTGWGNGDIYWACDAKTGNCTDFHALFIGLNRAVGIPATFEIGFPLPSNRTSGQIEGYHCWAQFYLKDVGWIPVDTSEANKNENQRDYFFGAHDQNRVLFSKGRDVNLQPPQQGAALNYFIYPYVEVNGESFDNVSLRFTFSDVLSADLDK